MRQTLRMQDTCFTRILKQYQHFGRGHKCLKTLVKIINHRNFTEILLRKPSDDHFNSLELGLFSYLRAFPVNLARTRVHRHE